MHFGFESASLMLEVKNQNPKLTTLTLSQVSPLGYSVVNFFLILFCVPYSYQKVFRPVAQSGFSPGS